MTESSRRGFLKYAGAGVAAAGAAAVVPTAFAGSANAETAHAKPEKVPSEARGSMVAYINDVHGDEMTVMVEGREVVVHDKALVTKLARHMHAG